MGVSCSSNNSDEIHRKTKEIEFNKQFNESSPFSELKASFKGKVLTPFDGKDYTEARSRPFNKDARGFPFLILQVECVEDIQIAVKFAVKCHPMKLCIMSGGQQNV